MRLRMVVIGCLAAAALAAPSYSAGHALAACSGADGTSCVSSIAAATGVYFSVSGKSAGGRSYVAVEVHCSAAQTEVYVTRVFVTLDASASGKSQTLYPPASTCTAQLEAPQSIDKFRVLDTIAFDVGP